MRWAGQEVILRLTTVPAGCTGANALRDPCFEPWHTYVMKATHIHIQSENTTLAWLRLNIGIKKICLRLCAVQRSPRTTTSLQLPLEFHTFSYVGQYFQWFSARVAQYIPPRTTKILDFLNAFQWFSTPYWGPSLLRSMILYPILGCLPSNNSQEIRHRPIWIFVFLEKHGQPIWLQHFLGSGSDQDIKAVKNDGVYTWQVILSHFRLGFARIRI